MSLNHVLFSTHTAMTPVSPMRGAPTFDPREKNKNGANLEVKFQTKTEILSLYAKIRFKYTSIFGNS